MWPTTTGGPGTEPLTGTSATTPVSGSIRAREPGAIAYSEPSALTSEFWVNVWWSISSAPHGAPEIDSGWLAGPVEADTGVDEIEDDTGAGADVVFSPPPDGASAGCCVRPAARCPR